MEYTYELNDRSRNRRGRLSLEEIEPVRMDGEYPIMVNDLPLPASKTTGDYGRGWDRYLGQVRLDCTEFGLLPCTGVSIKSCVVSPSSGTQVSSELLSSQRARLDNIWLPGETGESFGPHNTIMNGCRTESMGGRSPRGHAPVGVPEKSQC